MGEVEEIPYLSHFFPAYSTQWALKFPLDTISSWARMKFSKFGNHPSPGIEEKWSGIAIFEYSWFGLLLWNSACFEGRGLWDPTQSRLKHRVSALAAGLSDTEPALLPLAAPSPTQTPFGAHHSTPNIQNKTRGSKPSNLSYHFGSHWNVVC